MASLEIRSHVTASEEPQRFLKAKVLCGGSEKKKKKKNPPQASLFLLLKWVSWPALSNLQYAPSCSLQALGQALTFLEPRPSQREAPFGHRFPATACCLCEQVCGLLCPLSQHGAGPRNTVPLGCRDIEE